MPRDSRWHHFDEAALAAVEAEQFARELGAVNAARPPSILAFVAAIHGDEEEARRRADELLEHAAAHGLSVASASIFAKLGIKIRTPLARLPLQGREAQVGATAVPA